VGFAEIGRPDFAMTRSWLKRMRHGASSIVVVMFTFAKKSAEGAYCRSEKAHSSICNVWTGIERLALVRSS